MSEPNGTKHDKGKVRYDLLPPEALESIAWVLTFGARKYGDRNWEKGVEKGRLIRASLGHILKWWRAVLQSDEEARLDEETGISHLAHAACCIIFLLTYEIREESEIRTAQTSIVEDMLREAEVTSKKFKCMKSGCSRMFSHLPTKCPGCGGTTFESERW